MPVHTEVNGPHENNGPLQNASRIASGEKSYAPNDCPHQAQERSTLKGSLQKLPVQAWTVNLIKNEAKRSKKGFPKQIANIKLQDRICRNVWWHF